MRGVIIVLAVALALAGASTAAAAGGAAAPAPLRWAAPQVVDHAAPFQAPATLSAVACPTATACLAVGPQASVVSYTVSGTHLTPSHVTSGLGDGQELGDISCPSASLCAVTGEEDLLVSTNPTAARPRWRNVKPPMPKASIYSGVACPSAGLCVAYLDSNTIRVSTNPAGGPSAWRAVHLPKAFPYGPSQIVCAHGTTWCMATWSPHTVATTDDPGGGPAAWHVTRSSHDVPYKFTCPSSQLCVGTGDASGGASSAAVQVSTDPVGGGSTWSRTRLALRHRESAAPAAIACATASRCAIAVDDGSIATTADAQAGAAAFTQSGVIAPAEPEDESPDAMACPTVSACAIIGRGTLSTVHVGPAAAGDTVHDPAGYTGLHGLACPAATLCVGVDGAGAVLRSDRPAGPASTWRRAVQSTRAPLNAVSCPSASFCAAAGNRDTVLTTSSPRGVSRWQRTHLEQTYSYTNDDGAFRGPFPYALRSISCPSRRLCVAGTNRLGVMVSARPTGGPSAWRYLRLHGASKQGFDAVSCPTASLCVAGDGTQGRVDVSTRPAAGARTWHAARLGHNGGITAVSCPTARLCLAGDNGGVLYSSTRPAGGRRAWRRVRLGRVQIKAVACRGARLCVVVDDDNHAYASTRPGGPRSGWHRVTLPVHRFRPATPEADSLSALACAPRKLCLAANGSGAVFPAAG